MLLPKKQTVYLAGGSFNCIYRIKDSNPPAVLRITVIPEPDEGVIQNLPPGRRDRFQAEHGDKDNDEFVLLNRARHMLTFLNQWIPAFGPSIVKEYGQPEIFSGTEAESMLRFQYDVTLCDKIRATMRQYANGPGFYLMTQTMEQLTGGPWRGTSAEEIFSLIWFFATSQRSIQFQHHDLKPDNLLTRVYSTPQTFSFDLRFEDARRTWTIRTDRVPVVIDLDFATIHNSFFSKDRRRVGTYEYAPPDALCLEFLVDIAALNERRFSYQKLGFADEIAWKQLARFGETDEDGYDMWAIGMILLENLAPVRMRQLRGLLSPMFNEYEINVDTFIYNKLNWDVPQSPYARQLFIHTVIMCAVLDEDTVPHFNQVEDYGFRYSPLLFRSEWFQNALANPDVQSFRQEFKQSALFAPYRTLIRRLMDWNPTNRGSQGVLLEELSRPGQLFYPFLVAGPPAAADGQFVYREGIMENKKRPLLTDDVLKRLGKPMDNYCCAQCLSRPALVQCGHGCGEALYCGQQCADDHYRSHQLQCIEARARRGGGGGRRRSRSRSQGKIHKVLEEFKHGELHSGSKHGPVVTNRKQAVAIALAEARRKGK